MKLFLVCERHKKVLGVGVVLDEPVPELRHAHAGLDRLHRAISKFLVEHSDCMCVFMNDVQFFNEDKVGYRRMDNDFGLPFKGPNVFTLEEANERESHDDFLAQYLRNLEACDEENILRTLCQKIRMT